MTLTMGFVLYNKVDSFCQKTKKNKKKNELKEMFMAHRRICNEENI